MIKEEAGHLPKHFKDFVNHVGIKKQFGALFSKEYNEILEKETQGEWVLEHVYALIEKITIAEIPIPETLHKTTVTKKELSQSIQLSAGLDDLARKFWFLKQYTKGSGWLASASLAELQKEFVWIAKRKNAGKSISNGINSIVKILMQLQGDAIHLEKLRIKIYQQEINSTILTRRRLARDLFPYNVVDLHIRRQKRQRQVLDNPYKDIKKIGLGIESNFKTKAVRRESVILDEPTNPRTFSSGHILYTAGWSLRDEVGE